VKIVACTLERHASELLAILNESIANSTALWEYTARPLSSMTSWFEAKRAGNYPVIGALAETGELLGFASYGTFRSYAAYHYTAEVSVYVRHDARGRGVGDRLLGELIRIAQERDMHVLIAGIDASNAASIALHAKHGFRAAGVLRQCGYKFGRWLDLLFYERVLPTPAQPREG
jgi:phosphinothricin acetyltransferase